MADITYRMTADEKQALEACKRVEDAHNKIGNAAERAGGKSKKAAGDTKASVDSVDGSVRSVLNNLGASVSAATLFAAAAKEAQAAFAQLEQTSERLSRKNQTLSKATMGMTGPDGRLLQTTLREAITAGTASGPVGAEEMTGLIASLLTSNNELGAGSLQYMDTFKKLKGSVDLQDLAPAIGTIADLMPELLPQDVADVALITGRNAGGLGKIGDISKTFKQLQALGVSNAQALELATRAQASDQGGKAVQSVIGAMTPTEQEKLAAATTGRAALTGDARLSAIMANPNQYLGASGAKIQAALNEGLPAGGDIYNQALIKDIVARTASAAGMDPTIAAATQAAGTSSSIEAIKDADARKAQALKNEELGNTKALMEMGAAEGGVYDLVARLIRRFDLATGGEVRGSAYGPGYPDYNPLNSAGMSESEFVKAIKDNTMSNRELAKVMGESMVFGKKVPALLTPPQ